MAPKSIHNSKYANEERAGRVKNQLTNMVVFDATGGKVRAEERISASGQQICTSQALFNVGRMFEPFVAGGNIAVEGRVCGSKKIQQHHQILQVTENCSVWCTIESKLIEARIIYHSAEIICIIAVSAWITKAVPFFGQMASSINRILILTGSEKDLYSSSSNNIDKYNNLFIPASSKF